MASKLTKGGWKQSVFGTGLMNYIAERMPYSNAAIIDNILEVNPKYKEFYKAGTERQEAIARHSISSVNSDSQNHPHGGLVIDKNYQALMYANVEYNKIKRLREYRIMGAFAEVGDALDEICDEAINPNEEGQVCELRIESEYLDDSKKFQVEKEFRHFIKNYDLEANGWDMMRQLLMDGELFFEHIIHKDHPNKGILGTLQVPTELVDPIYDNVQNKLIKGFLLRKPKQDKDKGQAASSSGGVDDPNQQSNATNSGDTRSIEMIPLDKNQVTYIHSNIWNETKTLRIPFIENARRSYKQLSLTEDAVVIYRLVRAPERLIFNVDVGNMPPPKAEAYLRKLMQQYWNRKTFDSSQGKSIQAFNPQSMLDSFWFAKRQGSDGTSVTSLPGGQNLGEITDLLYFVKKLYKSLKVPTNRVDPESQYRDGMDILREELKFAKFIIRLQQTVAIGFRDAFVTHLKLRDLWERFKLRESQLSVEFFPPTNFYEMREAQKLELKFQNYSAIANNELISSSYAQKKYLGWDDIDIKANREWMRKDSALKWELTNIETGGPEWEEALAAGAEGAEAGPGGMGGGSPIGGGGPIGGGMPPEFGPPPPGGEVPDIGGDVPPAPVAPPPAQ